MIRDRVLELLTDALKKVGITERAELQHPADLSHGDYATNIALKYSKQLKKNPMELAEEIKNASLKNDLVETVAVVKPGFINFYLSQKALLQELNNLKNYGKNKSKGKTILLEFGQPNTHKTPHIGHLFSYAFGESLARILTAMGNTVKRVNWQGDIGPHVAKCLYIFKRKKLPKQVQTYRDKIVYLQQCYQEGSQLYNSDKNAEAEIDELNKKIYDKDPSIYPIWKKTRQWCLKFYQEGEGDFIGFEKLLGIHYDKYYFESEGGPIGKKIVQEHIGDIFEESDGAVVFKGEKYGLHTRVFINRHGNPTYEGKEVGLTFLKLRDFTFNLNITTTANEQNEYFKVAFKACELLFPRLTGKLKHLGFGMLNLSTGKMSSRTGEIVDGLRLYELVRDEIRTKYKSEEHFAEKIALAAIKYSFLNSGAYTNMVFDLQKSIAKEGDSGPYLLYTYVRTLGILKQRSAVTRLQIRVKPNNEELTLLRLLYQFPEIVEKSAELFSPHLVATYLFHLAQAFNLFYQKHPVLKAEKETQQFRLALTAAVGQILQKGLYLLGIETVGKM